MATLATVTSSSALLVALARLRFFVFVVVFVLAMVLKVFSFPRTTSRADRVQTGAAGAGSARAATRRLKLLEGRVDSMPCQSRSSAGGGGPPVISAVMHVACIEWRPYTRVSPTAN
jgi:hypothetical protein